MVVAYRVGAVTYALARPLFRLPHFTLVNLLLERRAVPEFLQGQAKPHVLAAELARLLKDKHAAAEQIADLERAAESLGAGSEPASLRAAKALLAFIDERRALSVASTTGVSEERV
jgi:lipid-A-disaccharide synthase